MKDIFKLTFKDKKFKLKGLLYTLLIFVVQIISLLILIGLMISGNIGLVLTGFILLIPMLFMIEAFRCYIGINKLFTVYYPNVKVGAKDFVFKLLALITILAPVVILLCIISVLASLISEVAASGIVSILALVAVASVYYQLLALMLSTFYVILDQIENNQLGYKSVFKDLFKKLKKTRRYCGQIILTTLVYRFISLLLMSFFVTIALVIITVLALLVSSFNLLVFLIIVVYIANVITTSYINMNGFHFRVIRYKNVKKLLNS